VTGWFGFSADGFKKMNPIKINSYRPILRQLISGDLSTVISNIGRFFTANDMGERFSHIVSAASKKRDISRHLSRYLKQGKKSARRLSPQCGSQRYKLGHLALS